MDRTIYVYVYNSILPLSSKQEKQTFILIRVQKNAKNSK